MCVQCLCDVGKRGNKVFAKRLVDGFRCLNLLYRTFNLIPSLAVRFEITEVSITFQVKWRWDTDRVSWLSTQWDIAAHWWHLGLILCWQRRDSHYSIDRWKSFYRLCWPSHFPLRDWNGLEWFEISLYNSLEGKSSCVAWVVSFLPVLAELLVRLVTAWVAPTAPQVHLCAIECLASWHSFVRHDCFELMNYYLDFHSD